MDTILLFSDAVGLAVTTPPLVGVEPLLGISRQLVELRAGNQVQAYFSESLGNVAIGCRVEISRSIRAPGFGTLIPDFFSDGVADTPTVSSRQFFGISDESAIKNPDSLYLVRAMVIGDGLLSPTIRSVALMVF